MTFSELENLLKATIGLDASTIGSASIRRAVTERMKVIGSASVEAYWNSVCSSADELQELVEAVVIPETWFFRDAQAFSTLNKLVREEWAPKNPGGVLRILSVPCSTGEEPYSLAISLQGVGVSFQVEAMDISHRSIARAKKAVFGRNSFRGADLQFRTIHFARKGNLFELNDDIRSGVNFEQGNLLEENFGASRPKYDFIFCRNLLIYFDTPTQRRAFATLHELLKDQGTLFVGPSEGAVAVNYGFSSAKVPMAFAFRKGEPKVARSVEPRKEKPLSTASSLFRPTPPVVRPAVVRPATPIPPPRAKAVETEIDLDQAQHAADAGKLEYAAEICHAHIKQKGASAQAFYLLGLVQDANDCKEQAREFYRKALYLQPNHYDALMHLALLTKSLGDANGARLLQARAERVKPTDK